MRKKFIIAGLIVFIVAAFYCWRFTQIQEEDRKATRLFQALTESNYDAKVEELRSVLHQGISPNIHICYYVQQPDTGLLSNQIHRCFLGDDDWMYPMSIPIGSHNILALKVLLDNGADPRLTDGNGNTILQTMSMTYSQDYAKLIPIIKLLVTHGADLNGPNQYSNSVLDQALYSGSRAGVDQLLAMGAKPKAQDYTQYLSMLHIRPHDSLQADLNTRIINVLARSTSSTCGGEDTWVQLCLVQKNPDGAKLLIDAGFPVDKPGGTNSAIGIASYSGEESTIPLLSKHGAVVDPLALPGERPTDFSPLDRPVATGDLAAVKELVKDGASMQGYSLISIAAGNGNLAMVKYLLNLKQSPTNGSSNIPNPISPMQAVFAVPIEEKLAASKSSGTFNGENTDSLIKAASGVKISEQRHEIVRALIAHGYDPRQRWADDQYSPLFYAVICDDTKLVSLFTMYGAEMDPRDPAETAAIKLWNSRHPASPLPVSAS
jgi:ankyrin repeat protein